MKGTRSHLYLKCDLRPAIAHIFSYLEKRSCLYSRSVLLHGIGWQIPLAWYFEYFVFVFAVTLPFKMNIVARKNILNHNYSFCIYLWTNQLREIKFGTKKISNWPQPFLKKEWKRWLSKQLLWKDDYIFSKIEGSSSYRSLVIIKPFGYIVVVIVKSIIIDSTVHHITARNKKCIMQTKS